MPSLGAAKPQLPGADERTQRHWFNDGVLPSGRKAQEVAAGIWTQMHTPNAEEWRLNILAVISRHVPDAPISSWQDQTAFSAWFFTQAEADREGDDAPQSAPLELLLRDPISGEFRSAILHPDLLPVREGDQLRIKVTLRQPAFLRLIWLDQRGKPSAMHHWPESPSNFQPIGPSKSFLVPAQLNASGESALTVEGPRGLETILLLISHKSPVDKLSETLGKIREIAVPSLASPRIAKPVFAAFPTTRVRTRGPSIRALSDPVHVFHDTLAAKLASNYNQLMLLSFPNAGTSSRPSP